MEILAIAVVAFLLLQSGVLSPGGSSGSLQLGTYARSAPGDAYLPGQARAPDGTQIIGGALGAGGCIAGAAYLGAPQAGAALAPLCAQLGELAAPAVVKATKGALKDIKNATGPAYHIAAPAIQTFGAEQAKKKVISLIAYSNPITALPALALNAKSDTKIVTSAAKAVAKGTVAGAKAIGKAVGHDLNPFNW